MNSEKFNKLLFYISLLLLCGSFSIIKNQTDLDLWHRMAVGKIFSQLGSVIYHDVFSYFPTKPLWIDHEWLSGVVFYNIGNYFGDFGFIVFRTLIFFAILLLVHKTAQINKSENNKYYMAFYLILIVALIPGLGSMLRCQAFTYLFFTLWIYILELIRQNQFEAKRLIWIFPITALLWANLHGGFVVGLSLFLFYSIGNYLNKKDYLIYLKILLLCLPFTLINPYGFRYWTYLLEAITMPRPYIEEWKPLSLSMSSIHEPGFYIFLLIFLGAVCYKICAKFKNIDWVAVIILTAMLFAAVKSNRNVVFFSIASAIFCYKYYTSFWNYIENQFLHNVPEKILKLMVFTKKAAAFSLTAGFFVFLCATEPVNIQLCYYPTKAIEFIKINKLEGNLFVPFNWGSYAMWKLFPQNLVSMDGRYEECYTNQSYFDVMMIMLHKKEWKQTFDKYHHDVILLPKNIKTEKEIRKLKEWTVAYEDKSAVVFVPSEKKNTKWTNPSQDETFYIKTKYLTDINFVAR
jgi:hypothetical protein